MSNPINRKTIYLDDALEAIRKLPNAGIHWLISAEAVFDALLQLPPAQSNLQPTCNQLATDLISRQRVSDLFDAWEAAELDHHIPKILRDRLKAIPSVQPDIIRCNACKHWTQTTGNMPGFGLGDCDYLNAKLVSCNGFCYWAERRADG